MQLGGAVLLLQLLWLRLLRLLLLFHRHSIDATQLISGGRLECTNTSRM